MALGNGKSKARMSTVLDTFYARWRLDSGVVTWMHDDGESPPERLLQSIWLQQRVLRDRLKTLDGRMVRVLHPGFQSLEGGPDFRGAVIQMGDTAPVSGDIEVDIRCSGWRAHGHHRNPAFRSVMLHVVWDGETAATEGPPVLCLRYALDAPPGELSLWLGAEGSSEIPARFQGKCCAPLAQLGSADLADLLGQAARVRVQSKASQMKARARQVGWEQALWEGVFRALGYKHNVWPMQRLAELRPRWMTPEASVLELQARLLGIGGLLPMELTRREAKVDEYLKRVWDFWWRERGDYSDCQLPRSFWKFHGLRPANAPQRRLALAAHWSRLADLPAELERWCDARLQPGQEMPSLARVFQSPKDDFWSWHWSFRSPRLEQRRSLVGEGRITDLAVNVVLPWLWARAAAVGHEDTKARIEERYLNWPLAQDNSVLSLARQRLLAGHGTKVLCRASHQQGVLQIVRDFCDNSTTVCDGCKLPALVENWQTQGRMSAFTY